ncbi:MULTISPECIES: hypothetical protein [Calothrix]|uniref:Uncharacterized protein n=2 Tax=Calothrix TaxID=1186 RepID=A0ABR8ACV1_9CYAN|nr:MULTISPECIES: hypothetical protein [Calothrix]MBD2197840.1 hypothetical protein [Calothrix parietina FACHB-288]MBD2226244.1 hypothetical protein [Calothrix anomala FACHB-343]
MPNESNPQLSGYLISGYGFLADFCRKDCYFYVGNSPTYSKMTHRLPQ